MASPYGLWRKWPDRVIPLPSSRAHTRWSVRRAGAPGRHVSVVLRRKSLCRSVVVAAVSVALAFAGAGAPAMARGNAVPLTKVIVQQWDAADPAPAALLATLGGTVTAQLPIVGGFAATLPTSALGTLATGAGVRVVSPDGLVLPDAKPASGGG